MSGPLGSGRIGARVTGRGPKSECSCMGLVGHAPPTYGQLFSLPCMRAQPCCCHACTHRHSTQCHCIRVINVASSQKTRHTSSIQCEECKGLRWAIIAIISGGQCHNERHETSAANHIYLNTTHLHLPFHSIPHPSAPLLLNQKPE